MVIVLRFDSPSHIDHALCSCKKNETIQLIFVEFFDVNGEHISVHLPSPFTTDVRRRMKTIQTRYIALTYFTQQIYPLFFFDAVRRFNVQYPIFSDYLQNER